MFGFIKSLRRRRLLAEPFPQHWEVLLRRHVRHYSIVGEAERARLRDLVRVLIAEKEWVGCGGLHVTETMKLVIAASASVLALGFDGFDAYRRVQSILIYPGPFRTPNPDDGYEDDELSDRVIGGQAWYRGPVILNWPDVEAEAAEPDLGFNLTIHEFAHQLDFLDGETNGTPPLATREAEARWERVMTAAYERHLDRLKSHRESFFTEHAGDDPGEFFADATEAYFCRPHDLEAEEPDVFNVLMDYFRCDPRPWFPA